MLAKSLSDYGNGDLAFMLLNRKEYPSWLYPVTQGATTIWERWDGQKPDGSFQSVGMNSFNHYAYGAIGEWMYSYIAGIKIDELHPGYKHFYLEPHVGGELTNASASINTLYGKVVSNWTDDGNTFNYSVEIPANTTSTMVLENAEEDTIEINDSMLKESKSIKYSREGNTIKIELGSGKYQIKYSK